MLNVVPVCAQCPSGPVSQPHTACTYAQADRAAQGSAVLDESTDVPQEKMNIRNGQLSSGIGARDPRLAGYKGPEKQHVREREGASWSERRGNEG